MKNISLIFFLLLTVACGKSKDDSPLKNGQDNVQDLTDRRLCQGPAVPGINIQSSTWERVQSSDAVTTLVTRYTFSFNTLTLALTCSRGATSVTVYAHGNVALTPSAVTLTSSDRQRVSTTVDGREFSCEVNLQESATVPYTFQGPCLVLLADETLILPPSQTHNQPPPRHW